MNKIRRAITSAPPATAAAYMPNNYHVVGTIEQDGRQMTVLEGFDRLGWTLKAYVMPRLNSGLYSCLEITEGE